jgi:hypothetical protein
MSINMLEIVIFYMCFYMERNLTFPTHLIDKSRHPSIVTAGPNVKVVELRALVQRVTELEDTLSSKNKTICYPSSELK